MVCRNAFPLVAMLLAVGAVSAAPTVYTDDVTIDRSTAPVTTPATFTMKAAPYSGSDTGPRELTLSVTDVLEGSDVVSVGAFRLHRPFGAYLWQFSTSLGAAQQAMELNNDHSLTLHSPAGGIADSIVLKPGQYGGVFFNGVPLVSSLNTQLATLSVTGAASVGSLNVAGASQLAALNVTSGIAANGGRITNPGDTSGVLAVGSNSLALGPNAAAIGENAISFDRSIALGTNAFAGNGNMPPGGSVAIGANSWANNRAMALGDTARAGNGSTAVGVNSLAYGNYGMALLFGETLGWYSMAAHGGKAWADNSYAGSYSLAEGNTSTAIAGGYSKGTKSFAANSGVAWADYSNAIGRGTVTQFPYQVALGTYNVDPGVTSTQTNPTDTDPLFVIGNGNIGPLELESADDFRSNAFKVTYNGNTEVQGALVVGGVPNVLGAAGTAGAKSVFKKDVTVEGVLRVAAPAGDISMGDFTAGPQP